MKIINLGIEPSIAIYSVVYIYRAVNHRLMSLYPFIIYIGVYLLLPSCCRRKLLTIIMSLKLTIVFYIFCNLYFILNSYNLGNMINFNIKTISN